METKHNPAHLHTHISVPFGGRSFERPHYVRIAIFILVLLLCFANIPATPAQAQEGSATKTNVFKFYLDPALVPDMEIAKAVLPKYVEDMNVILAKNTSRRLEFDPNADIIIAATQPFSNQATSPLPVDNFEIWAYAVQSETAISYGGFAGVDTSGAGVIAGMKWARLYDPDALTADELTDYWTQINNMLHELAHVFGAGIGEYYKLANIADTTGVSPQLAIDLLDAEDVFWSDKPDFMADPLLRNAATANGLEGLASREDLLGFVRYADLTAAIVSGDYRNALPTVDLENITVNVINESGAPLEGATVKMWSVVGAAPYSASLMVDELSDANGQVSFAWGGSANPHNNYDFLRLIKVYQDGYVAAVKYVSIFDADIVKLVQGRDRLDITIAVQPAGQPPVLTSIIRANANPTTAEQVSFTVTFSEPVSGVDITDFILETNGLSGADVRQVSGAGNTYTVTAETGNGAGTVRLNVVDDDTIVNTLLTPLGGVGVDNGSYTSEEAYDVRSYQVYLPAIYRPSSGEPAAATVAFSPKSPLQ